MLPKSPIPFWIYKKVARGEGMHPHAERGFNITVSVKLNTLSTRSPKEKLQNKNILPSLFVEKYHKNKQASTTVKIVF